GSYSNYFFVTNTHGDVVALTDRDGNVVNRYAYGPWGEATRVSEQVHQPFRYGGYRYEDSFDLYYLRARWYDAGTGRFLSRDEWRGAAGRLASLGRYLYAYENPATLADYLGSSPREPRTGLPGRGFERLQSGHGNEARWRTCPSSSNPSPSMGWPSRKTRAKLSDSDIGAFANTYTSVCNLFIDTFIDLPSFLPVKKEQYWIPALISLLRQIYVELARDPTDCATLGLDEIPVGYRVAWEMGVIQSTPSFDAVTLAVARIVGVQWGDVINKLNRGSPGRL
ncbi:MAG: hypothetical protein DCC49_13400, partial [Acidobacteria bacterium]